MDVGNLAHINRDSTLKLRSTEYVLATSSHSEGDIVLNEERDGGSDILGRSWPYNDIRPNERTANKKAVGIMVIEGVERWTSRWNEGSHHWTLYRYLPRDVLVGGYARSGGISSQHA